MLLIEELDFFMVLILILFCSVNREVLWIGYFMFFYVGIRYLLRFFVNFYYLLMGFYYVLICDRLSRSFYFWNLVVLKGKEGFCVKFVFVFCD